MPLVDCEVWPEDLLGRDAVVGLFVGGCVERGDGSAFRAKAHAHIGEKDRYRGWICLRTARHLSDRDLIRHELAHIISGEGHTDKWRAVLAELHGGEIPKCERLRRRVPRQSSWNCRVGGYHGLCWGKATNNGYSTGKRCLCYCHERKRAA